MCSLANLDTGGHSAIGPFMCSVVQLSVLLIGIALPQARLGGPASFEPCLLLWFR